MADDVLYHCVVCPDTTIQGNFGWAGHSRSKVHIEAGGDADSYETDDTADDESAPLGEAVSGLSPGELAQLLDENAGLKEKILRLERDTARNSPLSEWPVWTSADDVRAWLGPDGVRTIGELALVKVNRDRQRRGQPPMYSQDPAEYDRMVKAEAEKALVEMVRQQTQWTSGVAEGKHIRMRTFKMIAPARNCVLDGEEVCYRHGSMRQIPIETQINNGAASLNDPIERYKRKGFKPASPVRCKLRDCYRPAAADQTTGNWAHGMFCSAEHRNYVEGATHRSSAGNEMTVYESALTG